VIFFVPMAVGGVHFLDAGQGAATDVVMQQRVDEMPGRFAPVYENPSFKVFRFAGSNGDRTVPR
jgi:hypothetical protein